MVAYIGHDGRLGAGQSKVREILYQVSSSGGVKLVV
jgi:hypothetical protein